MQVGCKVTGDPNVPANHWSFVAQVTVVPAMSCCLLLFLHGHAAAVPAVFLRRGGQFHFSGLVPDNNLEPCCAASPDSVWANLFNFSVCC